MNNFFENKSSKDNVKLFESWDYDQSNYKIFIIGIALILVGYLLMASGKVYSFQSLTLAPIILFIGYLIIPISLILKSKSNKIQ